MIEFHILYRSIFKIFKFIGINKMTWVIWNFGYGLVCECKGSDFTPIQGNIVSCLNQSRCQTTYYLENFQNVNCVRVHQANIILVFVLNSRQLLSICSSITSMVSSALHFNDSLTLFVQSFHLILSHIWRKSSLAATLPSVTWIFLLINLIPLYK